MIYSLTTSRKALIHNQPSITWFSFLTPKHTIEGQFTGDIMFLKYRDKAHGLP